MRTLAARLLAPVLLAVAALVPAARGDVLMPGTKPVSHQLVLERTERWPAGAEALGLRLVAFPTRGFAGEHVVEPGVPFDFSSKYGTRLYLVPASEAFPPARDEAWWKRHASAEIPVAEVASAPVTSTLEHVLTTLRVRALDAGRLELEVATQDATHDRALLAALAGAAALGVLGLALLVRRRRLRAREAA